MFNCSSDGDGWSCGLEILSSDFASTSTLLRVFFASIIAIVARSLFDSCLYLSHNPSHANSISHPIWTDIEPSSQQCAPSLPASSSDASSETNQLYIETVYSNSHIPSNTMDDDLSLSYSGERSSASHEQGPKKRKKETLSLVWSLYCKHALVWKEGQGCRIQMS